MADTTRTEIYEALLQATRLTDQHRAELRKKRGFSDQIIDELRFRSGGKYVEKVLNDLRERFPEEDLVDTGILVSANGVILPQDQLLDDRVIIPYLDEEGRPYFIRPHKLGFRGLGIEIYCRLLLGDGVEHVVLTEGEFKAAALRQWGIPGIAIPGVSSFAGKHFDRLTSLLSEKGVRRVTVIFDNEIKDNPAFPSYKERPEDRWDTPFWAYVTAAKLKGAGFDVRIGQLPDSWREKGKIDFDGALAQGRTRRDIERVIAAAMTPAEFVESLSTEAQRIVRRKIENHFSRSPVRREFNRYVIERAKGEKSWSEIVSNFVIDIKSSFFTAEGCVRYVQFVNKYGERSDTFVLTPSDMVSVDGFRRFCFSKGSYIWQGSTKDLQDVWEYELARDMGDVVHIPEVIGEVKPGFWLFGNLAVYKGEVIRPDSDGIVWIEGAGYKPQSLDVGPHGETIEDAIPSLYTGEVDIKEIVQRFRSAMGGGYEACLGIGWVVSTLFSRPIFTRYRVFPIPFPHGKRESGKSTYTRWLMAFFGVETEGAGIAETTQNYIMRALSYYSSLGVWLDEYRNEPAITRKDGYLRSAYNRQLSGKGVKEAFGARSYIVRGTVIISGEELPKDNGLFTRCVPIRIAAHNRSREDFEWMNRNMHRFSGFTLQVLRQYEILEPKVMRAIQDLKEALADAGISDRAAENWAILAGSYYAVIDQDDEFIRWVYKTAAEIRREAEEEHLLSVFWDDVAVMVTEAEIGKEYLGLTEDRTQLAVWYAGLYSKWAGFYRQRTGREPFDRLSISRYIKEEPYFVCEKTQRLGGVARKCYLLDLSKAPGTVVEIAEVIHQLEQPRQVLSSPQERLLA